MRSVDVDGVGLCWGEGGAGRPVVLLHGLADSHRTWGRVAPVLARSRRVLALDLPGHGLSDRPDASYRLDWYADMVVRWLDLLGIDEVDLVGHSFGGGVAQQMLLALPGRVRRLALVAPGGLGREVGLGLKLLSLSPLVERIGQPFMTPVTRLGLRALGPAFDEDDVAWSSWTNGMPGSARSLSRTVRDIIDWRGQKRQFFDRAGEVEQLPPVHLYWGTRDPIIPIAHAARTTALVSGVGLTTFDAGHFPHREHADAFASALGGFLDATALPSARLLPRPHPRAARRRTVWTRVWAAIRRLWGARRRVPRYSLGS